MARQHRGMGIFGRKQHPSVEAKAFSNAEQELDLLPSHHRDGNGICLSA